MALEAPASRVNHLAGGQGDEAEPGQPGGLQGGEGHPDAVLAPQRGAQARLQGHPRHPGQVAQEEAGEVTFPPGTTVPVSRVSVLVVILLYYYPFLHHGHLKNI